MRTKYIFGIILVVLGLGFLLDQFDVISFGYIVSTYWPMVLILIGLSNLFDKDSSKFGNALIVLVGIIFQINALNVLRVSVFGIVIPLVLILIGLNILFSRKEKREYRHSEKRELGEVDSAYGSGEYNTIDSFAFMSGVKTHNRSLEFRGGKATAIMGGIDIDLRGAVPISEVIELELTTVMGGIDIIVPENWRVEIIGTPLLGDISNKTRYNTDKDSPLLRVKAFVLMGGIEIK